MGVILAFIGGILLGGLIGMVLAALVMANKGKDENE